MTRVDDALRTTTCGCAVDNGDSCGDSKDSALLTVDDRERLKVMGEGEAAGELNSVDEPREASETFRSRRCPNDDDEEAVAVLGRRLVVAIVKPLNLDAGGLDGGGRG